ncbi:MAG: hypothetical protein WCE21_02210 [Candidatus Babeliales bacterium]
MITSLMALLLLHAGVSFSMAEDMRDSETGCYAHPGMLRKDPVFKNELSAVSFITHFNGLSATERSERGKKPFINPADGHEYPFALWLNDHERAKIQRQLHIPWVYEK